MEPTDRLQDQVRANQIRSVILLAGFPFVLPSAVFFVVAVTVGMLGLPNAFSTAWSAFFTVLVVVVLVTAIWLPIGYFTSQQIIDAATGARVVGRSEEPRVWNLLEGLCSKCGMRVPALRMIETEILNAFASGLKEGEFTVAVTRGLVLALNDDELEAVLAHELTHIRNRDCALLTTATILVGLVPMIQDQFIKVYWFLVMGALNLYRAIFSVIEVPLVKGMITVGYSAMFVVGKAGAVVAGAIGRFCSLIIHFALSRRREFMADAGAVEMTGNPDAMISALQRVAANCLLETGISDLRQMCFENPVAGLFSTHPPTEQRIQAILALGYSGDRRTEPPPREREAPLRQPPGLMQTPPPRRAAPRRSAHGAGEDARRASLVGVLMKALGGDPRTVSKERRTALYDRAREALLRQLRSKSPPPSEEEVLEGQMMLEDAIAEIEAKARSAASRGDW